MPTSTSMYPLTLLLESFGVSIAAYGIYKLLQLIHAELTSPLRHLPGPKNPSWFFGNLKEIRTSANSTQMTWAEEFGPTFKYKGLLSMTRLYTKDTKALNHVLMNTNIWQKPEAGRYHLGRIVGEGVLVVEGEKHKQQRKVMNPAFGPTQIRELTEIFVAKAQQLRDIWTTDAVRNGGVNRIDVLSWLSRATLDIIGLAGFNYQFDALNESHEQNELNAAFSTIFHEGQNVSFIPMLRAWVPFLRFLPAESDAAIKLAQQRMARIGGELLRESKVANEDKSIAKTRDLLTLCVKSNMSTDLPVHQRMSDEDVLAQVPTFLVAGHETTSTATTWALFALCKDKRVQEKLREELLEVDTDSPTMDELNALPYLDMVVRETMRVHPPVPSSLRQAMQDDILPLHKPFTDTKGVVHDCIKVYKGQTIQIPILGINQDKSIWGEDALEFRPERWQSIPEGAHSIPGIWGNLLTFLGGHRACIGYRFSLVEMKALLFTLIRALEFELAVPAEDITKKSTIVQRPMVITDPKAGNQLPLLVKSVVVRS